MVEDEDIAERVAGVCEFELGDDHVGVSVVSADGSAEFEE